MEIPIISFNQDDSYNIKMKNLTEYLNKNLYSDKTIYINNFTNFRVFSREYPEKIGIKFQIFKIYNYNFFCLYFLNFIYRIYQECDESCEYVDVTKVLDILNTKEKIQFNWNYIEFLRNNIFFVIYQGIPHLHDPDISGDNHIISVLEECVSKKIDNENKTFR